MLRTLATTAVLGLVVTVSLPPPARCQTPPPPPPPGAAGDALVTTDTPEYCETLADRVRRAESARPNPPSQADELAEEGHHMCATGLIRGGLVRLRRAWLMLRREK